jgi:outer membrane protein TolC
MSPSKLGIRGVIGIAALLVNIHPATAAAIDPSLMMMPRSPSGQNLPPVALSAVFDESLVNSPRAATIRAQLGITRAAYAQALVLPNPSLFFLEDTAQKARQIGASVTIEAPWKLAFRVLGAKAQIKQADFEIQRNLWQLRTTVRRAYLDVVMATETSKSYEELQALASELLTAAQKRFAADDVAALDVNRSELAVFQADADLKQSNRKVAQAKQRLSVLMGSGIAKLSPGAKSKSRAKPSHTGNFLIA